MFKSDDPVALRRQLNRFNLPMFIAELTPQGGGFELIALNSAYEQQTGLTVDATLHHPLTDFLPDGQAQDMATRFAECIRDTAPIRFRQMLQMPRGPMIWDTTLHHVTTRNGTDRVVGSAILVERLKRDNRDTLAFEDVRYFSATSACKLEQICSVLDAVEQGVIDPKLLAGSVSMLAGLCRSINSTMEELRGIAQERLDTDANPTVSLIERHNVVDGIDEVEHAISVLMELAGNLPNTPRLSVAQAQSDRQISKR